MCANAEHALMRKMFQSWVGLVQFFLVFTHFKFPKGKLRKPLPVCTPAFVLFDFECAPSFVVSVNEHVCDGRSHKDNSFDQLSSVCPLLLEFIQNLRKFAFLLRVKCDV